MATDIYYSFTRDWLKQARYFWTTGSPEGATYCLVNALEYRDLARASRAAERHA